MGGSHGEVNKGAIFSLSDNVGGGLRVAPFECGSHTLRKGNDPLIAVHAEGSGLGMEAGKAADKRVTVCVRFFDTVGDSGGLKGADIESGITVLF